MHFLVFKGLELKLTQCLNSALLAVDLMQRNIFALRGSYHNCTHHTLLCLVSHSQVSVREPFKNISIQISQ